MYKYIVSVRKHFITWWIFLGRQDSLSHQDAADAGSCATHHASNAIGSPHIIATDVRSSACSSLNADKPPTNNQVCPPSMLDKYGEWN